MADRQAMHYSAASRILADLTDPGSSAPPSPDEDPVLVPGYRILARLGSGGGGEVFKAVRDGSDHPVAIKVLRAPLSDKSAADRAWRELDLLESLRLPALPRILDYGIASGRLYFATEFIDGLPIDEHCARSAPHRIASPRDDSGAAPPAPPGPMSISQSSPPSPPSPRSSPLPLRDRVSLLSRLADAVQSLHEHGVIHRDLKPSNILIDRAGNPVIIDLGIAALLESASGGPMATLTEAGAPIGTPAFMSPEQARGQRDRISTRSDVYSLGAIATLLLTGRTPHDIGGSRATDCCPEQSVSPSVPSCLRASVPSVPLHEAIRRAAEDDPLDPRSLDPSLPKPLAAILAKACAREPAARYASAAELAADLGRYLRGELVTASPISRWRKATRWAGRHPIMVTTFACSALLASASLGSFGVVWWLNTQPRSMSFNADHSEARLESYSGKVVKRWNNVQSPIDREPVPVFAEFVDAPGFPSGRLLLTRIKNPADPDHLRLCVWRLDDLTAPLWRTDNRLLAPASARRADDTFSADFITSADVFGEPKGLELIVVHNHMVHSWGALRVYDLHGTVLYEVWHDGGFNSPVWDRTAQRIVCCGNNCDHMWHDLGYPDLQGYWPCVVFALHPQQGKRQGFINEPNHDPEIQLDWYRCVLPATAYDAGWNYWLESVPPDGGPRGAIVKFQIGIATDAVGLWLDDAGGVIGRVVGDGARNAIGDDRASKITLGDLPKPVPAHAETSSSP